MVIEVYSGFSKKINETKQPSGAGRQINVRLKDSTSVINPIFLVNSYNLTDNYVKWGSRYYFIDDINIVGNEVAEYICSTDVLATYKTNIGSSSQYVLRSNASSDGSISDDKYPTTNNPRGVRQLLTQLDAAISSAGTYVIGVKNGAATTGVTFYALNEANFGLLTAYMFSDMWLDATDISQTLQKMLCNPMDYITSCYWFPFDLTTGYATETIRFGYWTAGNAAGRKLAENARVITINDVVTLQDHPQLSRGSYLNGSPYTQVYIDVFGFGRIPVDANLFVRDRGCVVQTNVDLFTGLGELYVEAGSSGYYRALRYSTMFGVPVQLSQVTQDLIKPMYNSIKALTQIAAQNKVGAAASIADAIASSTGQVQTSGAFGSKIAFLKSPSIDLVWYLLVDEDNATIGRPLCKIRQISTLGGYMVCENVDIELPATSTEKRMVVDFMEGGFFYD